MALFRDPKIEPYAFPRAQFHFILDKQGWLTPISAMQPVQINVLKALAACVALSFQLPVAIAQGELSALTIANPTPEIGDEFGISVAAVGTNRVLIGAFHDNTGEEASGAAYLFTLEPPAPGTWGQSGNRLATNSWQVSQLEGGIGQRVIIPPPPGPRGGVERRGK